MSKYQRQTMEGEAIPDGVAPLASRPSFAPVVDKVGVPLIWLGVGFAVGYIFATSQANKRPRAQGA